jgi:hypothetical protein
MQGHPTGPSSADLATEGNALFSGLGIITFALFPVALPGLLLFVIAPLALVAVVGLLLAIPVVVPLWLVRTVRRGSALRRQRSAGLVDLSLRSRAAARDDPD